MLLGEVETEEEWEDEGVVEDEAAEGAVLEETGMPVKASEVEKHFRSGAGWFYWIAGLSLVNSVLTILGSEWGFFFGLGITMFVDVIGTEIGGPAVVIALVFNVMLAGVFVLFGFFAGRNQKWAFITGMVLYTLDGMLFLLVGDFLSLIFHAFALWCIVRGYKAGRQLIAVETAEQNQVDMNVEEQS